MAKLESLSGGSGVHLFLVLWKAARAVESYAEKSITELEMMFDPNPVDIF